MNRLPWNDGDDCHAWPLAYDPEVIVEHFLGADSRLLLFGESGIGKSALAAELAHALALAGRRPPSAPSAWQNQGW